MKFYFLTVLAAVFFSALQASALNLGAQITKFEAANYNGRTWGLTLGGRIKPEFQPSVGVSDFTREYNGGGSTLHEVTYSLGLTSLISPSVYIDANVNGTPRAEIAARESGDLAIHKVVGNSDFGLKLGYSNYLNSKAGVLVPSLYQDFSEQWAGYFALYVVRTDSYLTSGQMKWVYAFTDRHRFALNGAGGRTLEDAGVEANFKSLAFEYTYSFSKLSVGLSQGNYWSNLRAEKSYSLILGFKQ